MQTTKYPARKIMSCVFRQCSGTVHYLFILINKQITTNYLSHDLGALIQILILPLCWCFELLRMEIV